MVSDTWIPVDPAQMPPSAQAVFMNAFEVFRLVVEDSCAQSDPGLVQKFNAFSQGGEWPLKMGAVHVPSKEGFNCIVHNDSWCNNFMFK